TRQSATVLVLSVVCFLCSLMICLKSNSRLGSLSPPTARTGGPMCFQPGWMNASTGVFTFISRSGLSGSSRKCIHLGSDLIRTGSTILGGGGL
ncbi:uncharacterized protein EI90DRAFT_3059484, partial [Cantharellus anzutake]|uniref:uncharacterized protein n=1 Tax=Cantharellus anzutake TaxID=1750568 RepID=UPI001908D57F